MKDNPDAVTYPFDEIKRGTKVHLYALWMSYQFTQADTILNMTVGPEQITLGGYGASRTKNLKNIVIANFKDS